MDVLWFVLTNPYALSYATAALLCPGAVLTLTAIAVRSSVSLVCWTANTALGLSKATHASNGAVA